MEVFGLYERPSSLYGGLALHTRLYRALQGSDINTKLARTVIKGKEEIFEEEKIYSTGTVFPCISLYHHHKKVFIQ